MWKLIPGYNSDRSSSESETHELTRPESPLSGTSSILDEIRFKSGSDTDEDSNASKEQAITNQVLRESRLNRTRNVRRKKLVDDIGEPITRNVCKFSGVTVHSSYELNIELNFEENTHTDFSGVLSFIASDFVSSPQNAEGIRIPHVCLFSNSTKMHICTALNGNWNHVWNSQEMPLNTWFKLTIKQSRFQAVNEMEVRSKFIYEIMINDLLMHQAINASPRTFRNVHGYLGECMDIYFRGEDPQPLFAAGKFRNFTFKSESE